MVKGRLGGVGKGLERVLERTSVGILMDFMLAVGLLVGMLDGDGRKLRYELEDAGSSAIVGG